MNSPSTPTPASPRPRLLKTPLRDLIRGRVTGRLDVPARIAPLHLPPEVADRCRPHRPPHPLQANPARRPRGVALRQAAMQIEAGWSPEEVLAELGDAKQRGREIRRQARAKRTFGRRLFDAMRAAAGRRPWRVAVFVRLLVRAIPPLPSGDQAKHLAGMVRHQEARFPRTGARSRCISGRSRPCPQLRIRYGRGSGRMRSRQIRIGTNSWPT
jgi:hypothetical protein